MKITVLGCGSSGGVPYIGCDCKVCTSSNPKNARTRVSILIESATTTVLVDTSPDMRQQFLREKKKKVDAIIYTHAHADHLHGIDDVRSFNYQNNAPLNVYSDNNTLQYIKTKFPYCFLEPKPDHFGWFVPSLVPVPVTPYVPFAIGDIEVLPFEQQHGRGKSLGLRFGSFVYTTDANGLSDAAKETLKGVDTWLVDCLRYTPAPTHAHLEMTLGWIAEIKPRRAYLTHMGHEFEYDTLLAELPKGVEPAYDGLVLDIA